MEAMEKKPSKITKKRKIKRLITTFFLVMVFILWSVYAILKSDLLNLENIEIQGNKVLSKEEIIEVGELSYNRNILQFKLTDIEKNIISHPFIKEVDLKRKLPKTMIITVKEREKYAIIPYMGSYIYIDQDKVVLESTDSYLAEDLVLITGVEFESFKLGDRADIKNPVLLDTTMEIILASKIVNNAEMISEINIGQEDYIKLITFDGIEVLISNTADPAYTMLALKEVLTNIYTRNISNIIVDMRYKGQISIRNKDKWEED